MAAPLASGSGCLVVSDPDFRGQNDCLPYFVNQSAEPTTTRPTVVTIGEDGRATFRASVPMQTCALTAEYEARVFVGGVAGEFSRIQSTGSETRVVSVVQDVSASAFDDGCITIELLVSRSFRGSLRVPERADDLAYIAWQVATSPDVTVGQCGAVSE